MGITIISAIFFAVLFNVIILGDTTAQHLRATFAGLIAGGVIGYFINYKFNKRLKD